MPKLNTTAASLLVATLAAGGVALGVDQYRSVRQAERTPTAAVAKVSVADGAVRPAWTASAPGRVEPAGGEVRIGAQLPGRVAQVLVRMNDTVRAGDLLVRLSDEEPLAKLAGAQSEVAVRKRERDEETAAVPTPLQRRRNPDIDAENLLVQERRKASDATFEAGRKVFAARMALDDLQLRARTAGSVQTSGLDAARKALADAKARLVSEEDALRKVEAKDKMPLPTRLEAGLATARAELALIETAVERTRIRAPSDGTVLQVHTRAGETVTPSPEDVLLVFGDVGRLQVRAEVEERDALKIRSGQAVVIRSDAVRGKDFVGKVARIAQALGAPRLAGKGPRRPIEHEVLQVLIDIDGPATLLPGMRVDVFFKPDETVGQTRDGSMVRAN